MYKRKVKLDKTVSFEKDLILVLQELYVRNVLSEEEYNRAKEVLSKGVY